MLDSRTAPYAAGLLRASLGLPPALALLPILVGAAWVHAGNRRVFSAPNGGSEYPVFLIVASLVQALLARAVSPSLSASRHSTLKEIIP